jgi:hypothetical protein
MSDDAQVEAAITALSRLGPSSGPELARQLEVSQSTLSRLVRRAADSLLIVGSARAREIVPTHFEPALPGPADADIATTAWAAAVAFWARVVDDGRVSVGFREIAETALAKVAALEARLGLLPTAPTLR